MDWVQIPLPSYDDLHFGQDEEFVLCLTKTEEQTRDALLPGHLVALIYPDESVHFYLDSHELGFGHKAITHAKINIVKPAQQAGWIELEAYLICGNKPYKILKIDPFSETGLAWFMTHKTTLEHCIGQTININDCRYDK